MDCSKSRAERFFGFISTEPNTRERCGAKVKTEIATSPVSPPDSFDRHKRSGPCTSVTKHLSFRARPRNLKSISQAMPGPPLDGHPRAAWQRRVAASHVETADGRTGRQRPPVPVLLYLHGLKTLSATLALIIFSRVFNLIHSKFRITLNDLPANFPVENAQSPLSVRV